MKRRAFLLASLLIPLILPGESVSINIDVPGLSECRLHCPAANGWQFATEWESLSNGVVNVTFLLTRSQAAIPPKFTVQLALPQRQIRHLWSVNDNHFAISPFHTKTVDSSFSTGIPLVCLLDDDSGNRLTVALSECRRKVTFKGGIRERDSAVEGRFHLFEEREAPLDSYRVVLRFDTRERFFGETIGAAVKWMEEAAGVRPIDAPPKAFSPLYSTWYAFHQDLKDEVLERECRLASELGMEAIILDDGWQTDKGTGGYHTCGDWLAAPSKFADMAAHVKRVQAMGMKYLLWYSVPFVGYDSANFKRFEGKYLTDYRRGRAAVLDPRFPEVRRFLSETYEKALREWNLDGFKLDFIDRFKLPEVDPAVAENYAGRDTKSVPEAAEKLLREVRDRLTAVKPDVLLEFRQSYIGPVIRQYGNMLRAGDCPGDNRQNRTAIANLRLVSGSSAVHADMLEWHRQAKADDAALAILSALFGVIQYSAVLEQLPSDHLRMVRHWIGFTKEHRATLLHSDFRPYHPELGYPLIVAESSKERIIAVYATDFVAPLGLIDRPTLLVNATKRGNLAVELLSDATLQAFNTFGEKVGMPQPIRAGLSRVAIPSAGYARLTPTPQID